MVAGANRRTGWPGGLLQDEHRKLAQWFASRPGTLRQHQEVLAELTAQQQQELGDQIREARDHYYEHPNGWF